MLKDLFAAPRGQIAPEVSRADARQQDVPAVGLSGKSFSLSVGNTLEETRVSLKTAQELDSG